MLKGKVPVDFDELYPRLYPVIALIARGKMLDWWIFKQYGRFRVTAKLYYPEQPRTGKQQGWKSVFYDAVKGWQGFDIPTKQYYNALKRPNVMSGYNRYLKFYLEANYPMIIYWDPLKQSASQNITIPDYMSETYFAGIQKIRTFTTYPVSPPYGGIIYKNNLNEVLANLEGLGWSNLREWTWKRTTEEDWSANRCTGGTATAEDENLPNEGAAKAFDANYETKWIAPANQTPWIRYQFAASATYIIERYRITAGNDFLDRDIKSWQFQGSNNGSDWDTLHTVEDEFFGPRYEQKDFYFKNNTAYEYYQINVTANWGSGDCQLMEIEMYEFEG